MGNFFFWKKSKAKYKQMFDKRSNYVEYLAEISRIEINKKKKKRSNRKSLNKF